MSKLEARVERDRATLAAWCNDGRDLGALVEVRTGMSTPHNGGQTVARLRFADGPPLIYKPRPVGMERLLAVISAWLARHDPELAPRAPATLERDGYGYCEYVAARPWRDATEQREYHERLGSLAALLAELAATDCRRANIVGCGTHPVLVDAEALLHPRIGTTPSDPLLATEILASEVVTSCGQTVVYPGIVSITDHRAVFDRGVGRMRALLAAAGPPPVPPGGVSRLVLRPTEVYAKLLRYRHSARFRAHPAAGWQRIEQLLARFEDDTFDLAGWEAVRSAEHAALQRDEVPYFLRDRRTRDVLADGRLVLAAAL